MSGLESFVILYAAPSLAAIVALRFVIHELRALVRECRELKAEFLQPLPPSRQLVDSSDTRSKNVAGLALDKLMHEVQDSFEVLCLVYQTTVPARLGRNSAFPSLASIKSCEDCPVWGAMNR